MPYEAELGRLKIALAGDCILTRRLSVFREDRFLRLRDIFCDASAGFANFESSAHEYLEGSYNLSGGTYITTEPALLDDMKWFGINMVSCAGSHSFDYGEEGVIRTMEYLNRAGIAHAGIGHNLREAVSPAYLDTPQGRVGLVAASSHISGWAIAGEQRPDALGRPGVNPLRFSTTYTIDAQGMKELQRLGTALGGELAKERKKNQGDPTESVATAPYDFFGNKFVTGDTFSIHSAPHAEDMMQTLRQVREAKGMADRVVVSLHYHELGGPGLLTASVRSEIEEPADFVYEFAHRCIDEGADIFVGHGPQVPLGIEIYKNKPIFYSLGSLVFQLETIRYLPDEAYRRFGLDQTATPTDFLKARYKNDTTGHPANPLQWQQLCAVCSYDAGKLREIVLHPLDLGFKKWRSQRGRPLLAEEEVGKKIIERVARLSKRLGTEVLFTKGQGIIAT